MMSNEWVNKYVDEEGNVDKYGNYEVMDNKLTLSSDGYCCLTEDLEEIIDKYTGSEDWMKNTNYLNTRSEIRLELMDLIHDIVNKDKDQ